MLLIKLLNYIIDNFATLDKFSIYERHFSIDGKNINKKCLFIGCFEDLKIKLCDFDEFALGLFDYSEDLELLDLLTSVYNDFDVEYSYILGREEIFINTIILERS